jgi:hypothetical protein
MIGANQMMMHQSIALLRLSPRIDDKYHVSAKVFKLCENYSLKHVCKSSTNPIFRTSKN